MRCEEFSDKIYYDDQITKTLMRDYSQPKDYYNLDGDLVDAINNISLYLDNDIISNYIRGIIIKGNNGNLIKYGEDADYLDIEELEKIVGGEWIVKEKSTNRLCGGALLNVVRYLWYFLFPLQIVAQRHEYDKIIGWQQFYALNYAFFCRLFALKKVNDVTVMTFIYRRKKGLIGNLYHRYMNYIIIK